MWGVFLLHGLAGILLWGPGCLLSSEADPLSRGLCLFWPVQGPAYGRTLTRPHCAGWPWPWGPEEGPEMGPPLSLGVGFSPGSQHLHWASPPDPHFQYPVLVLAQRPPVTLQCSARTPLGFWGFLL